MTAVLLVLIVLLAGACAYIYRNQAKAEKNLARCRRLLREADAQAEDFRGIISVKGAEIAALAPKAKEMQQVAKIGEKPLEWQHMTWFRQAAEMRTRQGEHPWLPWSWVARVMPAAGGSLYEPDAKPLSTCPDWPAGFTLR